MKKIYSLKLLRNISFLTITILLTFAFSLASSESSAQGTITETFNYTGSIQNFEVPSGVANIKARAVGGSGGAASFGGGGTSAGADISGDISVTPGQTLQIVVGQEGQPGSFGGGGGGGSFLYTGAIAGPGLLIAAGGGGGGGRNSGPGCVGSVTNFSTGIGNSCLPHVGGGSPGACGPGDFAGGGGAGWLSGAPGPCPLSGGFGGDQWAGGLNFTSSGAGGFGGGGGGSFSGGGGGGYSGGQGDVDQGNGAGGGGSFNAGINQNNIAGVNTGNGYVILEYQLAPVPTMGEWGLIFFLLLLFTIGVASTYKYVRSRKALNA